MLLKRRFTEFVRQLDLIVITGRLKSQRQIDRGEFYACCARGELWLSAWHFIRVTVAVKVKCGVVAH